MILRNGVKWNLRKDYNIFKKLIHNNILKKLKYLIKNNN